MTNQKNNAFEENNFIFSKYLLYQAYPKIHFFLLNFTYKRLYLQKHKYYSSVQPSVTVGETYIFSTVAVGINRLFTATIYLHVTTEKT